MTQKAGPAGIPFLKTPGSEKLYCKTWKLYEKSVFLLERVFMVRKSLGKFVFHLNPTLDYLFR